MQTITLGAVKFYFLNAGENLTQEHIYGTYAVAIVRVYVIWPRGNKWDLRYRNGKEWSVISNNLFDSEYEAFNFANEHLMKDASH
ncbi:MAG: hypothetical protein RSG77_03035 [Hafnia sp.]